MPIKRAGNQGLGAGNNSFPIWDLGCRMYWKATDALSVQEPGGSGWSGFSYTETVDDYLFFDPGLGKYRQVAIASPEFPKNGFVAADATNFFDETFLTDRGFDNFDGDLTKTNPAPSGNMIIDIDSTGLADTLVVSLAGATSGQFSANEFISDTYKNIFSLLLRRSDGGVIDDTVAQLFIAEVHAGENEGGATIYEKIRDDGWYSLSMVRDADADTSKRLGVVLFDGYEVQVEYPALERSNTNPQQRRQPAPDIGTENSKGVFKLDIASNAGDGTTQEPYQDRGGWIAMSVLHHYDNTKVTLPVGWLLWQGTNAENYTTIEMSSSAQHLAGAMYNATVNQFFLNVPNNQVCAVGEKSGVVLTWGFRNGNKYAYLARNGEIIEVDQIHTFPAGTPTKYQIGYDASLTREPNCGVQEISIGRGLLTRQEARYLSRWCEKRTLNPGG